MPLLRFDLIEGRSEAELTTLLDASHRAMVRAFNVPDRDRYQIVHQHPAHEMIVQDTGLGFERTENVVMLQVTSRPRTVEEMQDFYWQLCVELEQHCAIAPEDVMVSMVQNTDASWSFGKGKAQFLTGEL